MILRRRVTCKENHDQVTIYIFVIVQYFVLHFVRIVTKTAFLLSFFLDWEKDWNLDDNSLFAKNNIKKKTFLEAPTFFF